MTEISEISDEIFLTRMDIRDIGSAIVYAMIGTAYAILGHRDSAHRFLALAAEIIYKDIEGLGDHD